MGSLFDSLIILWASPHFPLIHHLMKVKKEKLGKKKRKNIQRKRRVLISKDSLTSPIALILIMSSRKKPNKKKQNGWLFRFLPLPFIT